MIQNINLGNLTSAQGFTLTGIVKGDLSGYSVAGAGDVNGDSIPDIIVGAPHANSGYVIFGQKNGFDNINLASLAKTGQGFTIYSSAGGSVGISVSGAGDINKDGFDDVIIGAPIDNYSAGKSYVVFGSSNHSDINLANLLPNQGFSIAGFGNSKCGTSVSRAGDINGDGIGDIIVGAYVFGSDKLGTSYVIFGNKTGFTNIEASTDLSVNGIGFSITANASWDEAGYSVSGAGDFNKDGYDDIIIGAPQGSKYPGVSYLIFGSNHASNITLANLTLDRGFSITGFKAGDGTGYSVSGAGDINGYADVIIGAPYKTVNIYAPNQDGPSTCSKSSSTYTCKNAGTSYVIFGKANGFNNIDLFTTDLVATKQGFSIAGSNYLGTSGYSVSNAGDVNKDGFDDIIIGETYDGASGSHSGASYVIFGRKDSEFVNIDLYKLTPDQGFSITASVAGNSGWSVSGAGDLDRDGYSDLLIGQPYADPNGISDAGITYVLFGGHIADSNSEIA